MPPYTDPNFGWLQIRNMLPSPSFKHAIQNTSHPGDEKRVMGSYLPHVTCLKNATAFEKWLEQHPEFKA